MKKTISHLFALVLSIGLIYSSSILASAAQGSDMKLKVISSGLGGSVSGHDFKFWNSTTRTSYFMKTGTSGTGYVASDGDNSYTVVGGDTLEGFLPGTYDILDVLANKGAGYSYPSYITIDIVDDNGNSIRGDRWPQTFCAPGGSTVSGPVAAAQGKGAKETITIDPSGNARLNRVEFYDSDLGTGKTVMITVHHAAVVGTSEGVQVEEVETPAELLGVAAEWYDFLRFDLAPITMALIFAACGYSLINPAFVSFSSSDSSKIYSKVAQLLTSCLIGFFLLVLLPVIIQGAKGLMETYSWKP